MMPITHFAFMVLVQLLLFLIHAYSAGQWQRVPRYLLLGMLFGLPFGFVFDLSRGLSAGISTYFAIRFGDVMNCYLYVLPMTHVLLLA